MGTGRSFSGGKRPAREADHSSSTSAEVKKMCFGTSTPSYAFITQGQLYLLLYMFRPNWPSSDVQVVVVKDYAAHCNAVFFPPIVVALQ
jgi:hypothetical protein